ncbi:MAG: type II secretion system minor pseudopilin GspK [bacterium]|nr:general secretion pathway protein GspK [Gammaproteobacteria bacterium]HIL95974.1 general secretion pathway protein GspK [Pseudomonadales bacterium]
MDGRSQKGVALITILLVVVIATVLGVSMSTEQNFAINRARSFFDQGIARQYAYGGEELARQILHEDFVDSPGVVHLGQNWAQRPLTFEFEDGAVELIIEDLQSKLNLNSLSIEGQQAAVVRQRFVDLLGQQGVDAAYIDRVVDWIDVNESKNARGAEDYDYLGLERPYRTASGPMADVTELRLILEMEEEQFELIQPYVTAVPDPYTQINVNTTTVQVLQAIAPGLPPGDAESIVMTQTEQEGFDSIDDFVTDSRLPSGTTIKKDNLSVNSTFFQVSIRAHYHERVGYLTSIIQVNPVDGTMRVVYRDQSRKVPPYVAPGDVIEEDTGADDG